MISVHGFGKVGAPLCAALLNQGYDVFVDDPLLDSDEVVTLPDIPFEQPSSPYHGVRATHTARLRNLAQASPDEKFSASFIIVPTPSDERRRFSHVHVQQAITKAQEGRGTDVVIVLSTLDPVRAAELPSDVVYCPLMIALGNVYFGITRPKYQMIGTAPGCPAACLEAAQRTMRSLQGDYVPYHFGTREEIAWMKLIVNSYLSYKITFFNKLWLELTDRAGWQDDDAAKILVTLARLDERIGQWGSTPGRIPGGPCLPRDTALLDELLKTGVHSGVMGVNEEVVFTWVTRADQLANGDTSKIAVSGLSYKRGIPNFDSSTGSEVAKRLSGSKKFTHTSLAEKMLRELGCTVHLDFTEYEGMPRLKEL